MVDERVFYEVNEEFFKDFDKAYEFKLEHGGEIRQINIARKI